MDAVSELSAVGDGDILVFCPASGRSATPPRRSPRCNCGATEVLPLYARLSAAEQHRVFAAHTGRRIVLATNVAETSLTVPGIRYVVDPGTARISRYSARTKVQRLPIEPISQASANQRAGRCGRVAPGVCIRLYSEEDFLSRPEFTEPEILRTNLASVILQMAAADLGDIATFPFVEAPDRSQINDGLRLLERARRARRPGPARAAAADRRRTAAGPVPVDPRLGRMLLAGERQGCLREMMIIVAGLSIQDPRERPAEQREKADALHRRFWAPMPGRRRASRALDRRDEGPSTSSGGPDARDGSSDFVACCDCGTTCASQQKSLSGNALPADVPGGVPALPAGPGVAGPARPARRSAGELKLDRNDARPPPTRVHTAVLTGLLSHVGWPTYASRPEGGQRPARPTGPREYLGARGTRFAINPGSSLARTQPPLVMAAEIVETTRLWARTVAPVNAEQVEEVGAHLLKRQLLRAALVRPRPGRCWRTRRSACSACRSSPAAGSSTAGSTRSRRGRSSSGRPWSRASGAPGTTSSGQPGAAGRGRGAGGADPASRPGGRRPGRLAFYDARVPADITSAAHFDALVEAGPARRRPTCSP